MLIVLIAVMSVHLDAQVSGEIRAAFLTQGFVLESLSGLGFPGSNFTTISNISSCNPASLYDFETLSLGLSHQFDSELYPAWIAGIGHKRVNNYFPQSVGLVFPINIFRFGLGFSQRYNSILDFGKIPIVTLEQPEGTGETFSACDTTTIKVYSVLVTYSFQNVLFRNDNIHLGLQCNLNRLDLIKRIWHTRLVAEGFSGSWSAGVRYDFQHAILPDAQIGIYFEKGAEFRETGKIQGEDLKIVYDVDNQENNQTIVSSLNNNSFPVVAILPDKLHLGFLIQPLSPLKLTFDLTEIFWNQVQDNNKDHIDISGSVIFQPFKTITTSIGFYSTDRKYNDETNSYFNINGKLKAFFITGGVIVHFNHFDIDLSYANSNSYSGSWRKQTIFKFGIGLYL